VIWGAGLGLASCDEIGAGPADCVLDEVGDEQGQDEGYEPAEYRDVGFMSAWLEDEGPCKKSTERHCASVNEKPGNRYALYFGVWILYGEIIEGEHAVERLAE